jgi:ABC-type glycerol-3-phosphate transport system substrate-binding protein
MKLGTAFKFVLLIPVAGALGVWLFADTARHYSADAEDAALRVSFRGSYLEYAMWSEMLDSFRKAYPQIEVRGEYVAGVSYEQKMQQLLVAGAAPDVMITDREPFPAMLQANHFEDLRPFLNTPGAELSLDQLWPDGVEAFNDRLGGEGRAPGLYGLSCWGACLLICYNRACFDAAKITVTALPGPEGLAQDGRGGWLLDDSRWTNDEFVKVAQLLTKDFDGDGRTDQFGMLRPGYFYWLPWCWAMGADVLDETGTRTTFYGEPLERAFTLWQDLVDKYRVCPGEGEMPMGPYVGLMSGRIAMMETGPWAIAFLNDARVRYDFLHMPRATRDGKRATRVVWDGLLMYNGSKKKLEAWLLIRHLVSPECQAIVGRYQRSLPALRSAKDSFVHHNPNITAQKMIDATADYGRPGPLTPHWYALERALGEACDQMIDTSPRARLTPAQAFGCFLSSEVVRDHLPPVDPVAAKHYVELYNEWRRRR